MYPPCLLYNMRIRRMHHYNSCTSGFVPKNEKWCWVSMSRQEISDPWPSIYWKRSDLALQLHSEGYKSTILSYGKKWEIIQLWEQSYFGEITSYWVCIPLCFKLEHSVQPPISSLIDWELHCLSSMILPLVEDWSGGGPIGRNLVAWFRTVPTQKFVMLSLLLINY